MSSAKKPLPSQTFSHVLAQELDAIRKRREHLPNPARNGRPQAGAAGPPPTRPRAAVDAAGSPDGEEASAALQEIRDQKTQRRRALEMHLAGLSISGGGIRSATFALGLLQGLAELKVLRHFDYISTVSGGGYIGSWLA